MWVLRIHPELDGATAQEGRRISEVLKIKRSLKDEFDPDAE